ncbi:MAG: beta-galactosidase, partial [bacterium]|nr:beta-galactosidase [bacterium]
MGKIGLDASSLTVDKKPLFVYSGEIHYFRIRKKDWPDRIRKAKKANLNTVSSYIPWRWHSPDQGQYDLSGQTCRERDLVSYLELLKKEKVNFIARIGPVSNGEIINDGLPDWIFRKHPEIRLKDYAGRTNPYSALIDYHHPEFHKLIKEWYSRLIPVLRKYLADQGGPVILIQLDNEISMLNWLTKSPTYTDFSDSLFREHLRKKYADIRTFNKVFVTEYASFDQIKQPDGRFELNRGEFYFEWEEYYREFYALYYKKLYGYLHELGISLPVIANIPQIYDYDVKGRGNMGIMTTCMFKRFSRHVKDIIFGGAYQYRRVDYENFTDITAMGEIVRMITPEGNPMICAEMQTGIMFDRPVLYPSDVELNIKTSIGSGLNGINMYMFAGGENPPDMGGFGSFHNWQSSVGADGRTAPHYEPVKEIGGFIKGSGDLITRSVNVCEINIGLYTPYYQTEYLKGEFPDELMKRRDTKLFDGLLRLIRLAGLNYRFIDLKETSPEKLRELDNLWVFSLEFMDKETQEKLLQLIQDGKKVFFYPVVPDHDLNHDSCDLLRKALGIDKIAHRLGANRVKRPGDGYLYYGGHEIFTFETAGSRNRPLFLNEQDQVTCFVSS